jgi:anti-sigma regulatory factor (Ser/Thr protein kinase)
VGLSSFAASNNVLAIFWAFPYGMMAVCRMLFSISVGERDRRSLIDTLYICLTKGNLLMCVVVAFLVTCATPLTMMFYHDPSDPVFHMTVMGFRLLPLCMFPAVMSLSFTCYAQTIERRKLAVILPIIDGVVGVVSCSFILIPLFKMNGLYIANILNGLICCLIVVIVAWIVLKRFPRSLEYLMVIPKDFSPGPEDRLDITVRGMDQVVSISQQIIDFCKSRGINNRRAYFAGLCMEEMAGNVVTHGFTKDKKQHSVDIRVVHSGDDVILRIRDNCMEFNPTERAEINDDTTDGKNIGIRMVYKIADEVTYQKLLGLNVLTITL